jgi:hypothetical protein
MASSRKRKGRTHPSERLFQGQLAIDRMFDDVVKKAYDVPAPPILYHYTTWAGASGILSSQRFWATAHECTNDLAELASADSVIVQVAADLLENATGLAREALELFLNGYTDLRVGKILTAGLVCFSAARDDAGQWKRYADNGSGLCLGIRVLNEPPPTDYPAGIMKVDYSESSWRDTVRSCFQQICSLLSRAKVATRNLELGLNALYRIATHASMSAKQPRWAVEQEFRRVTLLRGAKRNLLLARTSGGGPIRYLPVLVRAEEKRISLAEITIGANQDAKRAHAQVKLILAKSGYAPNMSEYPQIETSTAH